MPWQFILSIVMCKHKHGWTCITKAAEQWNTGINYQLWKQSPYHVFLHCNNYDPHTVKAKSPVIIQPVYGDLYSDCNHYITAEYTPGCVVQLYKMKVQESTTHGILQRNSYHSSMRQPSWCQGELESVSTGCEHQIGSINYDGFLGSFTLFPAKWQSSRNHQRFPYRIHSLITTFITMMSLHCLIAITHCSFGSTTPWLRVVLATEKGSYKTTIHQSFNWPRGMKVS